MNTLQEYALRNDTDKNEDGHNYVVVYDPLFTPFRQDTFSFLEIGVYQCSAHRTWRDYFPNATIYGIDIDPKAIDKYKNEERMILQEVDQGNEQQLIEYSKNGPWKVILDDGSHRSSHQKLTFDVLWNSVEPGGYYIVEDTYTSFWDNHPKNLFVDCDETLVKRMLRLADEVSSAPYYKGFYSNYLLRREKETLTKYQDEVESIQFSMGLIIIKKRKV